MVVKMGEWEKWGLSEPGGKEVPLSTSRWVSEGRRQQQMSFHACILYAGETTFMPCTKNLYLLRTGFTGLCVCMGGGVPS